jgi:hypothetical protein
MTSAAPIRVGPLLLATGVLAVGLVDGVMLAFTTGFFGGGYGLRLTGLSRLAFAASLALLVPVATDIVSQQLHRVFGKVVGLDLLVELAGGRFSDAALNAISEAPGAALGLAGAFGLVGGAVAIARRLERRIAPRVVALPRALRLAAVASIGGALGAAALHVADTRAPTVGYGLDRKPSGMLLRYVVEASTDWDRDGFGWMSRPADPAPFDPTRHPRAVELPGNGVDENGLGGDLPAAWRSPATLPVPAREDTRRSFLLVFLESFRGDLVGRTYEGRAVTPVLDALAARGAASEHAYANNPFTWVSRAQLFQGRVRPEDDAPTLVDDFHARGYRVAYVSGQDEGHGRDGLVGIERADFFVDARAHAARKTSRTALTVSLQVSSTVVLEEVETYLTATRDDPRPLFLYVNLVDNHFPYHHDELERRLGVEPVVRSEIRPWNAERVLATYLQASANVDAAIGRLLALWSEHVGDAPVLVTADHGQAFYEEGMLGHGQSVAAGQTRVPLIVVGLGGSWPEPIGLADLRGLIFDGLAHPERPPRFVPDPARRIFQYTGLLEAPKEIALRSLASVTTVELGRGRAHRRTDAGDEEPLAPDGAAAREVIWSWEALRSVPEGRDPVPTSGR